MRSLIEEQLETTYSRTILLDRAVFIISSLVSATYVVNRYNTVCKTREGARNGQTGGGLGGPGPGHPRCRKGTPSFMTAEIVISHGRMPLK